jgi:hypothetical protein
MVIDSENKIMVWICSETQLLGQAYSMRPDWYCKDTSPGQSYWGCSAHTAAFAYIWWDCRWRGKAGLCPPTSSLVYNLWNISHFLIYTPRSAKMPFWEIQYSMLHILCDQRNNF